MLDQNSNQNLTPISSNISPAGIVPGFNPTVGNVHSDLSIEGIAQKQHGPADYNTSAPPGELEDSARQVCTELMIMSRHYHPLHVLAGGTIEELRRELNVFRQLIISKYLILIQQAVSRSPAADLALSLSAQSLRKEQHIVGMGLGYRRSA